MIFYLIPISDQERRQSLFLYKDPNDIFSVQSVLFQIALTSSSGQPLLGQPRKKVNILTKNPFLKRPMSCSDMPIPSFENMALIHFIYPKNFDEINLYLSALGAIPSEKSPGLLILCGLEDYLSKNFIERIQQLCKILALVKELKMSSIVALKLEENESEMKFMAKMHLFVSEVWTLEDHEEKITTSSPHISEKGQLILEINKSSNYDSKQNTDVLTYSKQYFSNELNQRLSLTKLRNVIY